MEKTMERRKEQRLRYHWAIWFAEDFNDRLCQGQMVDVSSRGAAFTCRSHEFSAYQGQHLTARFSVPKFGINDSFDMTDFTRSCRVCRVDDVNNFLRRIAIQFAEPLPFMPGEQAGEESEAAEDLAATMS
jgi:hypothetical protein